MKRFRQLVLILLVFAQIVGSIAIPLPVRIADQNVFAADLPPDLLNHWASGVVSYWMDQAVLAGFPDGTARPDAALERSQMITFINRAMGYTSSGNYQFGDVASDAWHAQEFLIARQAGYFTGFTGNMAYPDQIVNRAEAATLLCRVFNLTPKTPFDDLSRFSDYETALVSSPARSSLEAMVERDFLAGYQDNTLRPDEALTRATLMSMFSKIMQLYLNQAGVNHSGNDVTMEGNVVIRQSPATLSNITINGDLVIAPGSGDGTVSLDNVQVNGRILVMGGGDVHILNSKTNEMMINKIGGRRPVVNIENCEFERLLVHCPSDIDVDDDSVLRSLVVYPEANDAKVYIGADLRTVELFSPTAQVTLSSERGSGSSGDDSGDTNEETEKPGPKPSDNVEVFDPSVPQVWMPTRQYIMTIGSQIYIEAKVYPIGADPALNWATSKKDVATVNEYGFVSALKEGVTTITATSKERPELSNTAEVIVEFRNPINIELNNKSLTLAIKKSARLTATIFPITGVKQDIQWLSGDESIATVDKNGTVRGVKIGKTFVAAYVAEAPAVQARCNISVTSSGTLIEKLTLSRDVDVMTVGEKKIYVVEAITPTKATLKETNWWSSDTSVAMVYNAYNSKTKMTEAEVHAIYPGEFTLYCESVDGSDIVQTMRITVEPRMADSFRFAESNQKGLQVGDRVKWDIEFIPNHAVNQYVSWASTHPDILSVDQSGNLWAHKQTLGTNVQVVAYATYYPSFQPLKQSVVITGREVEFLSFFEANAPSQTSVRVPANGSKEITIAIAPSDAAEKKLSFKSADESILTVSSTGDTTASLRGVKPGVTQLEVTHDTSGAALTLWIVVASDDFVQFLTLLKDRTTANFSNIYEPSKFFYYDTDTEYEAASFFYAFQDLNKMKPSPDASHEIVFYGSLNAWMTDLSISDRLGRLPREAQSMAKLLEQPNELRIKLTSTTEEQWQVYRTFGSLWLASEANHDLSNISYFTSLRRYLMNDNGYNTMTPYASSSNMNMLNLNHLLARTTRAPLDWFTNGQISNVEHASAFINTYSERGLAAAVAQITSLPDTFTKTKYAERVVFANLNYADETLMDKQTELQLLAKGYLYSDLDRLLELDKFKGYVSEVLALPIYFPNLYDYMKNPGFQIDLALAYHNYGLLFPSKTPEEVISYINQMSNSGGDYVNLLKELDGRYAIFVNNQRISEVQLPFDRVDYTDWRPNRVALYRRDGSAIYYPLSQLSFEWLGGRPTGFGEHILQISVTHNNIGVVAKLNLPVYLHGSDLVARRTILAQEMAKGKPQNYQDLLNARIEPGQYNSDLFFLADVMDDQSIQNGWLEYFEWYYGLVAINSVLDALNNPNDMNEFWATLRSTTGDRRTYDEVVNDYTLFKFFDIYLQRWLGIESNNRTLSSDFLWYPGDFLDLGFLDPRDYIVSLSKMKVEAGDKYQQLSNPDGFLSSCPLESHRTGLFFSDAYAFRQATNISTVGELVERFIALCNDNPLINSGGNSDGKVLELSSNWLRDRLKSSTQYTVYSYDHDDVDTSCIDPASTIEANLWEYFRKIDDELLPLLTLPIDSPVRVIVMPGIIMIGSKSDYDDQSVFWKAIGKTILDIAYNLESRHAPTLRADFRKSWSEQGPVLLFDVDRVGGSVSPNLTSLFYAPLRYQRSSDSNAYSGTRVDRIELGPKIFGKPFDPATAETEIGGQKSQKKSWDEELQHLLMEAFSLHDAFGYNNDKRLLPQEMGGMMLSHQSENWLIDWNLADPTYSLDPGPSDMQQQLQGLWESRTMFDLWWGDLFLKSQRLMADQSYRYSTKPSLAEYSNYRSYSPNINPEMPYVYMSRDDDREYVMPSSSSYEMRGMHLINGQYRLLNYKGSIPRNNFLSDTRYANFHLLNTPGSYFSLELDQNYAIDGITPIRINERYDLPRVNLMEQLFYRHGWNGVMSYLSADTEAASLAALVQGLGASNTAYLSWADWTLQEWERVREIGYDTTMGQTVAGLTYWEWQKLMQNIDDKGYLKEFFIDYVGDKTSSFSTSISASSMVGDSLRTDVLTAIDDAYRLLDGSVEQPLKYLFPAVDMYRESHNLIDHFPALWLINVTAKVGDHVYRRVADNLKLIRYGANLNLLNNVSAASADENDAWVEQLIHDWEFSNEFAYLRGMNKEDINRVWAYGYEDILWKAFSEANETDTQILNLLIHPLVPVDERVELLAYEKPDRDAYLFRRTYVKNGIPQYKPEYEQAYLNYSLQYKEGDYDTQDIQERIVDEVNALGTRYGQDLATLLTKDKLPNEWRKSQTMREYLASFLTRSAGTGPQTDPSIIQMIYGEFEQIFTTRNNQTNVNFKYRYDERPSRPFDNPPFYPAEPLAIPLDLHDLYERLEISLLPIDTNEKTAIKYSALNSYIERNGSYSFTMRSATNNVYKIVTLSPSNNSITSNQFDNVNLLRSTKRTGIVDNVYYRDSNFITFSNTISFKPDTIEVTESEGFLNKQMAYYSMLLRTSPLINSTAGTTRTSWAVTVTEIASNNLANFNEVHFLAANGNMGANFTVRDYLTHLIDESNFNLPELRLADRNLEPEDAGFIADTPSSGVITWEQAEQLALLGYDFQEIETLAKGAVNPSNPGGPEEMLEILNTGRFKKS